LSDAGGFGATARKMQLVQLHPEQQRDDERLDHFLGLMPDWICAAVELRHRSWNAPAVFDLLQRRRAAYVVMSGAGLPCIARSTTDAVRGNAWAR
jgi:uncharacterized protein YecE (DUF72 family)